MQFSDDMKRAGWIVERPAALYREALRLRVIVAEPVGQNGEAKKRIAFEFLRNVKAVFT